MAKKRKICVFSGKRGGFGAYLLLMKLIEADKDLELQVLLGDMHASKKFGQTVKEVQKFFPKAKIELIEMGAGRGDSPLIRTENLGVCLQKIAGALNELKPDIVLVHADRGEHLSVAFAALNLGIVVAHTQGGETSGNIDDIQRHAITKLSHLHFPETNKAAARLIKMGEEKWRIKVVGSTYIDRIVKKMYTPAGEARRKYGLRQDEDYFIVIFHPDTYLTPRENYQQMKVVLETVKGFGRRSIVVFPCSDPGYKKIVRAIEDLRADRNYLIYKNIDNLDFLGLMKEAKAIIGNSSCALVEAPYFQLPAINIGKRQLGRDREENVIDAKPSVKDLRQKINYALSNKVFREKISNCGYRLGKGDAAKGILKVLKNIEIDGKLLIKKMIY